MATYKDILNENQNWLKCSLALRITKAGLRNLVEGDSTRVQQKIHSSVIRAMKLAPGTSCNLCLTENLLLCPTRGLCLHPRNCKYHNSPLKIFRPCPSQICNGFLNEIMAVHRFCGPSWKNTKANQWCMNHWQVAKCFMPPDGYHDVTSFDETDFNGIISFMINCKEIQRSLSFPVGNQPNVLLEVRVIGRNIRHSPDLKVSDINLADYFATLHMLLTDSTYLASDSNAQQACFKLKELEKGTLPISSEDVRDLLEQARETIETGKREIEETAAEVMRKIRDVFFQSNPEQKEEVNREVEQSSDDRANNEREKEASNNQGMVTENIITTTNTSDQSIHLFHNARILNSNITINMISSPKKEKKRTRCIDSESD